MQRIEGFYDGFAAVVAADEERRLRSAMQSSQKLNPGNEGVPDTPD